MVSAATLNDAATLALANAMYRHTFGIVVDGRFGAEGCGLGSGIGVLWKNTYLILTADRVVAGTPFDRLYFLLPDEALEFAGSTIASGFRPVRVTQLTSAIRQGAIRNRNSSCVVKSLQDPLACRIESNSKSQATAAAKPEKHWTPACFDVVSVRCDVGRLGARHRLECKQFAAP
jgi:hypothetical protein